MLALCLLNLNLFDPLYRIGVSPGTGFFLFIFFSVHNNKYNSFFKIYQISFKDSHVEALKLVLEDILKICNCEEEELQMETLCNAKHMPYLGHFYKNTSKQKNIVGGIALLPRESQERVTYILLKALASIKNSIYRVHSCILGYQFSEDQLKSSVNNIFSERCFGSLDAVSRLHQNLKFVHRETCVMITQNKFWDWFKVSD